MESRLWGKIKRNLCEEPKGRQTGGSEGCKGTAINRVVTNPQASWTDSAIEHNHKKRPNIRKTLKQMNSPLEMINSALHKTAMVRPKLQLRKRT